MATIKSYTDLEQSKKLAKILPLESADMHYNNASIKGINYVDEYRAELMDYNTAQKVLSKYLINPMFVIIPCWSLAALLGVLPRYIDLDMYDTFLHIYPTQNLGWVVEYSNNNDGIDFSFDNKNLIDACYEMILKLYELKLL